jgi:hypothetical protein
MIDILNWPEGQMKERVRRWTKLVNGFISYEKKTSVATDKKVGFGSQFLP